MVHFVVKILFVLQLFIMFHNIQAATCNREVHVLNALPGTSSKLKIHCASKDDDLGYNYPPIGADFHFKFCAIKYTLFFCHFWSGTKDLVFDVFNDLDYCVHDGQGYVKEYTAECQWKVQVDGIYLGYYDVDADRIIYKKYRGW
ncbi:hypothetical protein P3S68_021772 [Capsicum galapagoense]